MSRGTTYDRMRKALEAQGYCPGVPEDASPGTVAAEEYAAVRTVSCPSCGLTGVHRHEPWRRGKTWLSLAVCRVCGHTRRM